MTFMLYLACPDRESRAAGTLDDMSQQTIPNGTWTRLAGTDMELRQITGAAITVEVDQEAGTVTVPLADGIELRSHIEVDPADDDPLAADKRRAILRLPFSH